MFTSPHCTVRLWHPSDADALVRHGRAVAVSEKALTPEALARAADDALSLPRRDIPVRFGGAETAADILMDALEACR